MLQTKVTRIDPIARQVTLDDGRTLSYSKALLVTGAAPKRPNFPGSRLSHVKLLRSLDDCRDILSAAQDAHHIAVVGGSFIGLEAAASLPPCFWWTAAMSRASCGPKMRAIGWVSGGVATITRRSFIGWN
jgi:NAD(P)H-nitrite reductase large subunit